MPRPFPKYFPAILLICILQTAFISRTAIAQDYNFTYYTLNEGLPTELIKSVAVTSDGFLYLATDEGLVYFNGQDFTLFKSLLHSPYGKFVHSLSGNRILVSDDMGLSMIHTDQTPHRVDRIHGGRVLYSDSLLWYPKLIYTDRRGDTWITDNKTIYHFRNGQLIPVNIRMDALPENIQRSFVLADDGLGNLFAFYEGGSVYQINRSNYEVKDITKKFRARHYYFAESYQPGVILVASDMGLTEILTDTLGEIVSQQILVPGIEFSWLEPVGAHTYIATTWSEGLFELNLNGRRTTYRNISSFPFRNGNQICRDLEDNLWIASDNGLILMQRQMFTKILPGLIDGYIQEILQTNDSTYLVSNGSSVFSLIRGRAGFRASMIYSSPGESILRMALTPYGLYMGGNRGNIHKMAPDGKISRMATGSTGAIFILVPDHKGNIWFCQDGEKNPAYASPGGIIHHPFKDQELPSRIISIRMNPTDGLLYFGGSSDDGYLLSYNPESHRLVNLSRDVKFEHNIPLNVNDLAFDDGKIWIASTFGVLKYTSDSVERLPLGNLSETTIKGITSDGMGNLWFTASLGIIKYENGEYYIFAEKDGIPSKTSSYRTLMIDSGGRLWSGTISGLAYTDNTRPASQIAPPVLSSVIIDGTVSGKPETAGLRLKTGSHLKFVFVTPSYPSKSLVYRYRIINHKEFGEWIYTKSILELYLTNWPTGKYTIQVENRKSGNYNWSEPLEIQIRLSLVWYKNKFILAGIGLAFILLVIALVRYNIADHKRRQTILEKIIQERTREITLQKSFIESQNDNITIKNNELESKNRELLFAKQKAEKLANARSLFLSTVSHELRTPLNAVIGMTYIMLNENPRPDQIENLNTLRFSAENLLALINDILDYSKIDAGKLIFEEADFDVHEKLRSIVQVLKIKADEKNIEVKLDIDNSLPEFLVGDPTRLNQILFNIAGNAVKFTEAGHIRIHVKKLEETDKKMTVGFHVSDTGIGIASGKIHKIFDSFSQAGIEITRKYGGTGLGLAITKKLVEMQGGQIQVESTLGKGSTFSIILDFKKSEKSRLTENILVLDEFTVFNGQPVLVVDDNQINLIVARKFLTKWNLEVDTAENGKIASEMVLRKKYALILMDLQMPVMDGETATRTIRKSEKERGIEPVPIFALTASALVETQNRLFAAGMNDYITKPFNPNELNYKISKILQSGA